MLTNANYKILNQSIDFIMKEVEDENLFGEFASRYRKTIFDEKSFLLREDPEKIIGIYAQDNGAGTSLVQKEDTWILNFGFSTMDVVEVGDILSAFQPLEKMLNNLCKDVGISLYYNQENNGRNKEDRNAFLREIILTPTDALIKDEVSRLFQIKRDSESTIYIFKSLNGESSSLNGCVELVQYERINAEEIFIPSVSHWLDSIKSPAIVSSSYKEGAESREGKKKKYIN